MPQPKSWLLSAYGEETLYGGNQGYTDEIDSYYKYDSRVQNFRRIEEGAVVVVETPTGAAGFARIERIEESEGEKVTRRCPECTSTKIKRRKTKRPRYRCEKLGHEFEQPDESLEPVKIFVAYFGESFVPVSGITRAQLRVACLNNVRQQSIRPIDPILLRPVVAAQAPEALSLIDSTYEPAPPKKYWAFLANPNRYRIDAAVSDLSEDVWTIARGNVKPGDSVVIWRAAGGTGKRGIVAFGTILTAPEMMSVPESRQRFWVTPSSEPREPRVWVRYHNAPNLPLWLDEDDTGLLAGLSVARATGGSVFKIAPEDWESIESLAGKEGGEDEEVLPDFDEAPEGRLVLRRHKARERNPGLVRQKKEQAENLKCEVCDFEFSQAYGELGENYIECHHIVPLAELDAPTITRLEDLSLVCANCHRMLHADGGSHSMEELRELLRVSYAYGTTAPLDE